METENLHLQNILKPMGEDSPFKQVYTENWIYIKDLIKSDANCRHKSTCIEALLHLMHLVDYREGEIKIDATALQSHLDCSRAAAYAVLKWFKDKGILTPVTVGQKVTHYKL